MDNFSQQNYSQQPYVGQPVSGQPAMSNMPPTPPAQINPVQPQPVTAPKKPKFSLDDHQKLMITIGAFSAALVAALIFGVAMFMKYNDASSDLEEKIDVAVAEAKDEQAEELEAEFAEREKNPYQPFAGPEDYGSLSFQYPRTWSKYVAKDAAEGGDFEAYLNPDGVKPEPEDNINALRVRIIGRSTESVKADYQDAVEDGDLRMEEISINKVSATHYYGIIPKTEYRGHIIVLKIRDKTAILQSDSELFSDDLDKILDTVTFND